MLFSLLITRPPTSTLFPYTTLFRSLPAHIDELLERNHLAPDRLTLEVTESCLGDDPAGVKRSIQQLRARDRKSTRLNSSHTVISYAVFCLKKKKKRTHYTSPSSTQR